MLQFSSGGCDTLFECFKSIQILFEGSTLFCGLFSTPNLVTGTKICEIPDPQKFWPGKAVFNTDKINLILNTSVCKSIVILCVFIRFAIYLQHLTFVFQLSMPESFLSKKKKIWHPSFTSKVHKQLFGLHYLMSWYLESRISMSQSLLSHDLFHFVLKYNFKQILMHILCLLKLWKKFEFSNVITLALFSKICLVIIKNLYKIWRPTTILLIVVNFLSVIFKANDSTWFN